MFVSPAPLPLKNEPILVRILPFDIIPVSSTIIPPIKVEPLANEVTTNPLLGLTAAVTAPL